MKRSQEKRITVKCLVLKHMRQSAGLSAREAGLKCRCSGPAIMHYENGRMEISSDRLELLVKSYGFSMQEYEELIANPPQILNLKQECIDILNRIDDRKLRAVHSIFTNFLT